MANVAMHENKILNCKDKIVGTWNVGNMNMGKVNRVKDEINQSTLTTEHQESRWTGTGHFHQKIMLFIQYLKKK